MRRLIQRVGDFLAELRRWRVYQATAIYLVLAVGGLEVVDILVPQTRLPDWSVAFFLSAAVVRLPFNNLSGAVAAEPLVVGLHDDLLTKLSRASALQVISGTSVRAFQREGRSASQTGMALGASTVVEGTVQMSGKRVRLNIQMVDARADAFCRGLVHAALAETEPAVECFEQVKPLGQLSTECLRYFYPRSLGPVRTSSRYPALLRAAEKSWGLG